MFYRVGGFLVVLLDGKVQQVARIVTACIKRFYRINDQLEGSPLTTQRLRFFRIIPNARLGELELYFFQPVLFNSVVKDTPSTRQCVREYL